MLPDTRGTSAAGLRSPTHDPLASGNDRMLGRSSLPDRTVPTDGLFGEPGSFDLSARESSVDITARTGTFGQPDSFSISAYETSIDITVIGLLG